MDKKKNKRKKINFVTVAKQPKKKIKVDYSRIRKPILPTRGVPFRPSSPTKSFIGSFNSPIRPPANRLDAGRKIFNIVPTPRIKKVQGLTSGLYKPLPNNKVPMYLKTKTNPFKIQTKGIRKKDMRWTQTLGDPRYKNLNPFKDADKDGVINMLDCRPFDPTRQEDIKLEGPPIVPADVRKRARKGLKVTKLSEEEFDTTEKKRKTKAERNKQIDEEIRRLKEKEAIIDDATRDYVDRTTVKAKEQALDTEWQSKSFEERQKKKLKEEERKEREKERKLKEKINKTKTKKEKEKLKLALAREERRSQREKTKRAAILSGIERRKLSQDKWSKLQSAKETRQRSKRAIRLAKLEGPKQRAPYGTIVSLERTSNILGQRIDVAKDRATELAEKRKKSKDATSRVKALQKQYEQSTDENEKSRLKADISMTMKDVLTEGEKSRITSELDYTLTKAKKAERGKEWAEATASRKKERETALRKSAVGWVPGAYAVGKERVKQGLSRYTGREIREQKAIAKRSTGILKALTSFGGIGGVSGTALTGYKQKGPIEYNPFEVAAIQQEQYDKQRMADAAKKAGRPFGSYKYGMPIDEYKKLQSQKERAMRIQEAMKDAQQVNLLNASTESIISGGITYGDKPGSQTLGQVSVPEAGQYTTLRSGPQYGTTPSAQISQQSYNTFREEESRRVGFDMPMRNYPRSMTLSQVRSKPNVYGDTNADPRYARIPTLPTDPAMIHDDVTPREYYQDQDTADMVAAESEGRYQLDPVRGNEPSLAGSVPMQYAAKVRDVRAPTTKNMVLQTQNDGQRKMVPIIKANPWGLQLKNRINFSENNILETDLNGNVASRDQLGGNILNTPNVFTGDTRGAGGYSPQQTQLSWLANKHQERPEVTGLGEQYREEQYREEYMTPEQQIAIQRQQMAQQLQAQQTQEERAPTFYERMMAGKLRKKQGLVSRSVPVKKPSMMDRLKGITQAVAPQEQDLAIDMTEEEFNSLPVEEQQRIIEQTQQQQGYQDQSTSAAEEMANYEALQEEQMRQQAIQDNKWQREAAMIQNRVELAKAEAWNQDHEDTNVRPLIRDDPQVPSGLTTPRAFSPGGTMGGTKYR